jgi:hypothetical protein
MVVGAGGDVARFGRAPVTGGFQDDGGQAWEVNWVMTFERV